MKLLWQLGFIAGITASMLVASASGLTGVMPFDWIVFLLLAGAGCGIMSALFFVILTALSVVSRVRGALKGD